MIYLAEPTSSNDEEDDDESENETHLISREVLMVKNMFCLMIPLFKKKLFFSNIVNDFNVEHLLIKKNRMMMKQ